MTITVTIKNDGPGNAYVIYYDEARKFKEHVDRLKPGESITINAWDGNVPVILPWPVTGSPPKFYGVPPATISG